jgi:hypothetical protein
MAACHTDEGIIELARRLRYSEQNVYGERMVRNAAYQSHEFDRKQIE